MEQEELKAQFQQEQLKWLQGQATSKNLLQLWQCEPFHCGLSLREAGRQWWQAHPKRQSQVLPQQEQLHQEDSYSRVGGSRRIREDDDDDEDSEAMAMASVAIATTPRVSLFDSPNDNITAKCLMAKTTNKVTPNIKTTIIPNPSLMVGIDDGKGSNEEVNDFESFMSLTSS